MVNNLQELQGEQGSSDDDEWMKAQEEIIRHSGFSFYLG